MVDVTYGSHVHVRLGALVLLLRHCYSFFESSLGSRLRNDLFGDRLRDFLIVMKFHAVDGATLGLGPQVGGVTEHVAQRHVGAHHLHRGPAFHAEDLAAPRREVTEDLAHEFLGHDDLDLHDRLEQGRLTLLHAVLGRHRPSDGEGHLVGVDLVVGAVHQRRLDVDHRESRQDAAIERLDDALLHRGVVFLRDRATHDLVDELESLARLIRFDVDLGVAVLAATTGLADEASDPMRLALDRFPVGNLRLTDVGVDRKLAQHSVDDDLEVQLAHPGDDGLGGLLVGAHLEGRVLLGQLGERLPHLFLIHLGARLDRHADDRIGENNRLEQDRVVLVGEGVARRRLLQADGGGDIAGVDLGHLLAMVGVHLEDAADPLPGAARRIPDVGAGFERAGVHPEERQLADVGIGGDLEGEARERLVVGRLAHLGCIALGVDPFHAELVQRRGQEVDDRIQHRLHPAVAERRAGEHRHQPVADGALAQGRYDLGAGDRLVVQVLLQQGGVELGDGVEDRDGAVQDAQTPLDLDREVYVPGCVDDVDPVPEPVGDRGGRGDRDATLLLLHHPVHGGGAVVDLTHLVDAAGIEEDAFGRGRLPGIDVGHDADVPDRKSTRLNSSHQIISYAVFCLKKKTNTHCLAQERTGPLITYSHWRPLSTPLLLRMPGRQMWLLTDEPESRMAEIVERAEPYWL